MNQLKKKYCALRCGILFLLLISSSFPLPALSSHISFPYLQHCFFLLMLPVQAWDGCSSKPRGKAALPSLLSEHCPLSSAALQVGSEDSSGFRTLLCLSFCQTNIGLPSFCFLLQPPPSAPLLSHCPLLNRMLKVCIHARASLYTILISFRLLLRCT